MTDLFPNSLVYESLNPGDVPQVTVAIPLYNHADLIEETLDSVRDQTLGKIDLVVVNDDSRDEAELITIAWLRRNARRFRCARVVRNLQNYGLPETRNAAFRIAETEYVFALDSDNQIYPHALERLLKVLDRTGAAFAYSQLEIFGQETGIGYAWAWEKTQLIEKNYIDAMALIRRSDWEMLGGYTQLEGTGWEDYDFWCKVAGAGREGVFVPQILCRYRINSNSMLRTDTSADIEIINAHFAYRHPWRREVLAAARRARRVEKD